LSHLRMGRSKMRNLHQSRKKWKQREKAKKKKKEKKKEEEEKETGTCVKKQKPNQQAKDLVKVNL